MERHGTKTSGQTQRCPWHDGHLVMGIVGSVHWSSFHVVPCPLQVRLTAPAPAGVPDWQLLVLMDSPAIRAADVRWVLSSLGGCYGEGRGRATCRRHDW